jgi:hypothetical protein
MSMNIHNINRYILKNIKNKKEKKDNKDDIELKNIKKLINNIY